MFLPGNLRLDFLPECEGCEEFEPKDEIYVTGYDRKHTTITCQHYLACRRTAMHCKEIKNKE